MGKKQCACKSRVNCDGLLTKIKKIYFVRFRR